MEEIIIDISDVLAKNMAQTAENEAAINDLVETISTSGALTPIVVEPQIDGKYPLIAGRLHIAAYHQAGKDTIPAIILDPAAIL